MSSNSETGHAKNVANFKTLISFCTSYGQAYQPSKANLKLGSLNKMHVDAVALLSELNKHVTQFNKATVARAEAFQDTKTFSTQLLNALAVSGAAKGTIDDAKVINRKMQGQRAKDEAIIIDPEDGQTEAEKAKKISVSQQSYDMKVEHLDKMLKLLTAEENYKPNEEELKVVNVSAKIDALKAANDKVVDEYVNYSNSLIARNNYLYNPLVGLVQVTKDVKQYILSVYKANSPQFKQVNEINFRTIK